ncbi:MAG: PhoH family protein [Draconibacterium sp.]|nr:PhoH family protein [Draconibacterium sp.]
MLSKTTKSKIFILDTNVILHDHTCIYQFEENDIILPITVLEELDKFKRGNDLINFQAREFTRLLDEIVGDELFNGGKPLGKGMGKLRIETGKPFLRIFKSIFQEDIPDHRILSIAEYISLAYPKRKTVLVSKDINLRMKAKSLGIQAEDYKTDQVTDQNVLDKTVTTFENFNDTLIETLYSQGSISADEVKPNFSPEANECFIFKGTASSALSRFDAKSKRIYRIEKKPAYGIKPRNAEQTFSLDILMDPEIKLVALTGKAGTGKTLLALAAAIEQNTRAGEGTKMVFTGDLQQIDSPYLDMKSNGLAFMTDRMRNQDLFAHINLVKGERSYLAELASNLLFNKEEDFSDISSFFLTLHPV